MEENTLTHFFQSCLKLLKEVIKMRFNVKAVVALNIVWGTIRVLQELLGVLFS